MPKVTNLCNVTVSLVLKSGEAVSIRPGETDNLDYDPENEHNRQMLAMGGVGKGDAVSAAKSQEASRRPARKAAKAPKAAKAARAPKVARAPRARKAAKNESPAAASVPEQD